MMNTDVATIVDQRTVELGLELPRSIVFVGLTGTPKIKARIAVLRPPLQNMPVEQIIGLILGILAASPSIPGIDRTLVEQTNGYTNARILNARLEKLDHPSRM